MADQSKTINYWKQKLQDLTELQLPTDYPRNTQRIIDAELVRQISNKTSMSILKLTFEFESPFSIIFGCFLVLLARLTGEEDLSIGSLSPKLNAIVLRLNITRQDSLKMVIQKVIQVPILTG